MSTATQPLAMPRAGAVSLARDLLELMKLRITSLVVMTAWCGFYLGTLKSGSTSLTWLLVHALAGIGLVASGAAALNQVMERDADGRMRRTQRRPLPSKRMRTRDAALFGIAVTLAGGLYLALAVNLLTSLLALATAAGYLGAYTPLKRISPLCTFVGAFPGAMPGVLGWTSARGTLEWEALALFGIVWLWQFPHFLSIAWLYREDYENAGIRMLPVVEADGRSTARDIVIYSTGLVVASLLPTWMGMAGTLYLAGALGLSLGLLWFGVRLARFKAAATAPRSKPLARHLLQASVFYLPLLFILMMINAA